MTGTLVQQWTMVDYTSNVGGKKNFWNMSSKNFTVSALGVSAGAVINGGSMVPYN